MLPQFPVNFSNYRQVSNSALIFGCDDAHTQAPNHRFVENYRRFTEKSTNVVF